MNKLSLLVLLITVFQSLSGCATVTSRELEQDTPDKDSISSRWLRHKPRSYSGDEKAIASDIVHQLRTICTPLEWEAVRLLGGRDLTSFSITNECGGCLTGSDYIKKFKDHEEDVKKTIELVLKDIPPAPTSLENPGTISIQLTYLDDELSTGENIVLGTNLVLNLGSVFILGSVIPVLNMPVTISVSLDIDNPDGETLHAEGVGSSAVHGLTSIFYDKTFKKGFILSVALALKMASNNLASSYNCLPK